MTQPFSRELAFIVTVSLGCALSLGALFLGSLLGAILLSAAAVLFAVAFFQMTSIVTATSVTWSESASVAIFGGLMQLAAPVFTGSRGQEELDNIFELKTLANGPLHLPKKFATRLFGSSDGPIELALNLRREGQFYRVALLMAPLPHVPISIEIGLPDRLLVFFVDRFLGPQADPRIPLEAIDKRRPIPVTIRAYGTWAAANH